MFLLYATLSDHRNKLSVKTIICIIHPFLLMKKKIIPAFFLIKNQIDLVILNIYLNLQAQFLPW
jgi:hypothetical protein